MKMLLFHNSDWLYYSLFPDTTERPFFYWYSDRHHTHLNLTEYVYLFAIDPKKDNIQLRSRTDTQDFDGLHKYFKDYQREIALKDNVEPGIVMSFSELKPAITLQSMATPENINDKRIPYRVILPEHLRGLEINFYDKNGKPIPFNDIPQFKTMFPYIDEYLPIKEISPDKSGAYGYEQWDPMITEKNGIWL